MTASRKQEAALRALRAELLEVSARDLRLTAADASGWRDAFLKVGFPRGAARRA